MFAGRRTLRAFIGEFDRVSAGIFLLGAAIGVVWLIALDLGVAAAWITVVIGSVALIIHHRWIEIGLLMIGIGLIVQLGYWAFGSPPAPPIVLDPNTPASAFVPVEMFAPGMAGLFLIGGVLLCVVIGARDMSDARRRERLDMRHRERRARQRADS